uniref:Uncharacterized protein n=1 Tax=Amphiprion percula TaxID=161767 RepID=A0A3P8TZH1_AMPPE
MYSCRPGVSPFGSAALCRPGRPSLLPASCDPPQSETTTSAAAPPAGSWSWALEKEPSCLVLASLSCSSCLWPRRYRYSMCITSVRLIPAFSLNSSRIRGMKPGLSRPALRNCRYRTRTCFCNIVFHCAASRGR